MMASFLEEKRMKVRLSARNLSDDEILGVKCPECGEAVGEWCVSLREPNLLIKTLHFERQRQAYRKAQAKDWQKTHKRMEQIRRDTARYNAARHELAQWVVGGQIYAWLKEYGPILWELGEENNEESN